MPKLTLHLQDGFDGDEVVLRIDDEERLRRSGVTTRRVVGLAAREELKVPAGARRLEIAVPNRGFEERLELEIHGDLHLGVSLTKEGLRTRTAERPFGYG